jgi:acid phosphatase (class A)
MASRGASVDVSLADITQFLPPPPAQDSVQTKAEIEEILQYQNTRTPEMVAAAQADAQETVFRFADVLGPGFTSDKFPLTASFFSRVHGEVGNFIDSAKDYYHRPRPYDFDKRVRPCVDRPWNLSYPSGHATGGAVMAVLLAHMVPEKKEALLARGKVIGENRVLGGVHYRSDVVAGEIAGSLLAVKILRNPDFQKDYEKSKEEIRNYLGLK